MNSYKNQEIAIEVNDISKDFRIYHDKSHTFKDRILFHKRNQYQLNHVLKHVSFTVRKGEALGLIGHNGCGKSTTLKLLNKILYPDSGSIRMHGRVSSLIELGAGFHPDMTGRENIYINASIFGLKKNEIDQRLDDIIRFSELENFIDSPVRTYSSGMYMRLAFAIAINVDADILLVDEILAVGDANFQKKCFSKLESIKKGGTAIVIVSHSMDQIRSICDNVIWLEEGEIKEQGKPQDVCGHYLQAMSERAAERHAFEVTETNSRESDPMTKYPISKLSPQVAKSATRDGNMTVRVKSFALCDENGNQRQNFHQQEHFLLKVEMESDTPEERKVELQIKMFNKYGGHCFTISSFREGGMYIPVKETGDVTVNVCTGQLVQGDYYLELVVMDVEKNICDQLHHMVELFIMKTSTREIDNLGIIMPTNQWIIEKTNNSII